MKIEFLGGTSKEDVEKRIKIVASAGKLSQFEGNVFEVIESSSDYEENLKVIKRITRMGHKSIMEHDYLVFAIADVTPIIEQIIIGNRLTSFTIKSRRYVDFRNAGFHVPTFRNKDLSIHMENEELTIKYKKHMEYLFKEYSAMIDAGIPNEDARFILPYSFHSNIVMGLDARELERMIMYLMHGDVSTIQEAYEVGEMLLGLTKKYVPYLYSNITKATRHQTRFDYKSCLQKYHENSQVLEKPELLSYTDNADDTIIEYAVMSELQVNFDEARRIIEEEEKAGPDFKKKYMDEIIHKEENRELEHVTFTYQIPISLSVLTHLTRHRMHSLMVPSFTPLWNFNEYIIPPTIKNSEFAMKYAEIVTTNMNICNEFRKAGVIDEDLVYFYLGCQMCNVLTTMNGRNLIWFSRMRCCNRAQWQIRNIANRMVADAKKVAPLLGAGFGPTCDVDRICNEGKKSCGKLEAMLKAENK